MASQLSSSSPQPQAPKESHVKRLKISWRVLLISNLALGAYIFASGGKKHTSTEEDKAAARVPGHMFARSRKRGTTPEENKAAAKVPSPPVATETTPAPEEFVLSPPAAEPMKVRDPIPDNDQLELFKWILEEKRQIKPKDRDEKKQIDEEKAILKQFIRTKSIPRL